MSDLKQQDYENEFIDNVEDEEIEFIEYDIDEEAQIYHDDVASLSKEAKKKQEKAEFNLKKEIMSWVWMLLIAIGIAAFVNIFVLINAVVPTGSMETTIPTGSRMIGLRLAYTFSEPERGDIVIFKNPFDAEEDYVKRVIGLPGETVVIDDCKVYIYDAEGELKYGPLKEPYINGTWTVDAGKTYEFNVPEKSYFVLGDNRNNSFDTIEWYQKVQNSNGEYSADIIYIKEDQILGQALFTYWDSFEVFDDVSYD